MKHYIFALLLTSCASQTTTTITRPDGKLITTVVERKAPSDGVITIITNALLGRFLTVFQSK